VLAPWSKEPVKAFPLDAAPRRPLLPESHPQTRDREHNRQHRRRNIIRRTESSDATKRTNISPDNRVDAVEVTPEPPDALQGRHISNLLGGLHPPHLVALPLWDARRTTLRPRGGAVFLLCGTFPHGGTGEYRHAPGAGAGA